jgi:hypothetical protein
MYKINKLISQDVIPRLVYIPYLVAYLLAIIIDIIAIGIRSNHRGSRRLTMLGIEAGVRGWEIIEYKELYQTAVEYLGVESIKKVVVHQDSSYLSQARDFIISHKPTHYAYSPRTGSQAFWAGMRDAFGILVLCHWYRVTPIVFLTDLPVRVWRAQSAVVTAKCGLVVSLMSPKLIRPIFPHDRIIGPYIMPLSLKTLMRLDDLKLSEDYSDKNNPIFTGSLYEPRTSTLNSVRAQLLPFGIEFEIMGRVLGSPRVSDDEYWLRLMTAPIVLTTADQIPQKGADWPWLPHFVYRYTEVLACGSLLIAPEIAGIDRYFTPGIHYVSFNSVKDAVEKIRYYQSNEEERLNIASKGKQRVWDLVVTRSFWLSIDVRLGYKSLT